MITFGTAASKSDHEQLSITRKSRQIWKKDRVREKPFLTMLRLPRISDFVPFSQTFEGSVNYGGLSTENFAKESLSPVPEKPCDTKL